MPKLTWAVRAAWGVAGLVWFLWVGYEDRGLVAVLIVGLAVSVAIGLSLAGRWLGGREMVAGRWLRAAAGLGLVTGLLTTPIAIVLILIKTSLHTHPYLDFSVDDVRLLAARTPIWAASGLMVGGALGLLGLRRGAGG